MSYLKDKYGTRSNEFIEGVIAGIEAYAVWRHGKQVVGFLEEDLEKVIQEVKDALGWKND